MSDRGMGGKQLSFLSEEDERGIEQEAQAAATGGYAVERGSACNCRSLLAELIKQQALTRKRCQALLKRGGHPFKHSDVPHT